MTAHRGRTVSEAAFRRMWADRSMTLRQIGEVLGISAQAVRVRAMSRGLPPRPKRAQPKAIEDDDLFRGLWRAGVPNDEIARRFGCCLHSVTNTKRRLGLPDRPPPPRKRFSPAEFVAMWTGNVKRSDMAAHFDLTLMHVTRRAQRLGLEKRNGRSKPITLAQFWEREMAVRMAREAAVTRAAMLDAEMVDGLNGRRAA